MNNELKAFVQSKKIAQQLNGRNRLIGFKDEIKYLKDNGLTYKDIVEFLETKNIKVTSQAVGSFYRKHFIENEKQPIRKQKQAIETITTYRSEEKQPEESKENINESLDSKQEKSNYEQFLEKREKEKTQKTKENIDSHPNPAWYTSKKKLSDLI
ncbi:hypothetical protein OURE66S_01227 [Oligella ureolytica]